MRIGGAAAAQEHQWNGSRVFNAVWSFRWDTERIARFHQEGISGKMHEAFALRDVVKLFGYTVDVHQGFYADGNRRLSETLF